MRIIPETQSVRSSSNLCRVMVCEWCCGCSDSARVSKDNVPVIPLNSPRRHSLGLPLAGKRYGYDFDGVLHTSVGMPDDDDHRHPTWFHSPEKLVPFPEMIQLIKQQVDEGAEIFIITAQHGPTFVKYGYKFLQRPDVDLDLYIPLENRIADKCGHGKAKEIKRLKLSKFYDDSGKNIKAVGKMIADGSLPGVELYQVYPERSGTGFPVVEDKTPGAASLF